MSTSDIPTSDDTDRSGQLFPNEYQTYGNENNINQNFPPQYQTIVIQPGIPQYQNSIPNNQQIYNPFQNVTSLKQIRHKGITQPEENKYQISQVGCFFGICFPMIFILVGLAISIAGIIIREIVMIPFGMVFSFAGFMACYCMNKKFSFILNENNVELEEKTICGKKSTIYNGDNIERIEFFYDIGYNEGTRMNNYHLNIYTKNEGRINLFNFGTNYENFTDQEMDYLVYVVNNHINHLKNLQIS
jgi:hypothetical protein